eukprot:Rhum_TRINITY_DN14841_c8_g2::Rhum_TRINITY_DN14841_c8_g2_i1::g.122440::m.122440
MMPAVRSAAALHQARCFSGRSSSSRHRHRHPSELTDAAAAGELRRRFGVRREQLLHADATERRRIDRVLRAARQKNALSDEIRTACDTLAAAGYAVGPQAHDAAVGCLADCGLLEDAKSLAAIAAEKHGAGTLTYLELIRAAVAEGRHTEADELWLQCSLAGVRPSSALYGAYLSSLSQRARSAEFETVFAALRASGERVHEAHFCMRAGLGRGAAAVADPAGLLAEMRRDGVAPTNATLRALLQAARVGCCGADAEKAFAVLARHATVRPTEREHTMLMCVHKDSGDVAATRRAYERFVETEERQVGPSPHAGGRRSTFPETVLMKAIRQEAATCGEEDAARLADEAEALFERCVENSGGDAGVPVHPWSTLFKVYAAARVERPRVQALYKRLTLAPVFERPRHPLREALGVNGLEAPRLPRRDGLKEWVQQTAIHFDDPDKLTGNRLKQ